MFTNIYTPAYQLGVYRRYFDSIGAERALLFDNTEDAVNEEQRKSLVGLAGYQRHAFLAAALSSVLPTTALLRSPLFWEEIQTIRNIRLRLGATQPFRLYLARGTTLTDMMELSRDEVHNIIGDFVAGEECVSYERIFSHHWRRLTCMESTAVMPFECLDHHQVEMAAYPNAILPSTADLAKDKNQAAVAFGNNGFHDHVTIGTEVPAQGSIKRHAQAVIRMSDEYLLKGNIPYIKVDCRSVSGLGNVSITAHPEIFDDQIPQKKRVAMLCTLMRQRSLTGKNPGRIEMYRPPQHDHLGRKELTIGGFAVAGQFFPMSLGRMILDDDDVYKGMMHHPDFSQLNLNGEVAETERLLTAFSHALLHSPYQFGEIAMDMIPVPGDPRINDWNFRRGGRTVSLVMMWLTGQGFYDNEYMVPNPARASVADLFAIPRKLQAAGLIPYSTSQLVFPEKDKVKVKVLIPFSRLTSDDVHAEAERLFFQTLNLE